MKWSKRLSRYTLPGMGLNWDASYFGLLFLAMVLIVLYTFLREYQNALRELYIFRYGTQILRQGAVMPSLNTLIRHKFTVFWAYAVFCALRAFANYWSFFTETKSIYLMKRLKDPNELRRRCIAIPAAACGAALVLFLLLLLVFVLIYRTGVPARCTPPEETLNIWVYGDNVFEKHGINRDRTGDGEKPRCLCGKRGIFNRDGAANYQTT